MKGDEGARGQETPDFRDDESDFLAFAEASDTLFAQLRSVRGRLATSEGLTISQAHLMQPLERHTPVTVSALARHARVAVPTATRMLQLLEQRGMVIRKRAEGNERVVEVLLTDKGADALYNEQQRLRSAQRRTFTSLEPGERAAVLPLLDKLIGLVDEL